MSLRRSNEDIALIAEVERTIGSKVESIQEKTIAPLVNGSCGDCGIPISFICVMLCDECMDRRQGDR